MEKFTTVTSKVIPLPIKDVDTDLIIPAQYLTSISREGFGQNLFRRLKDSDPAFPLNLPEYQNAKILLSDSNFGCGSSREHAVWAILGAGIRVVIAKSFADIFFGNSAKSGLLLVTLPSEIVDALLADAATKDVNLTVSLENQTVTLPSGTIQRFDYDPFRRHCLMNGLDDIDYIRDQQTAIDNFRKQQAPTRFFSTTAA
ncbi:MAG: 3-isopropylmalate dehydratase small subunit [Bdellovibrionota bacterium]